jgi:hypothetical protein
MTPDPQTGSRPQVLIVTAAAVVASNLGLLAIKLIHHDWIVDGHGRPWVTDFLEVWVAGLSVLKGAPAASYDWYAHHAAQVAVVGHPFAGYLGWHYPPLFLFVAGALALLPYMTAFLVWVAATAALYAGVIAKIAQRWHAALFALALPAAFGNILVGQNGFFTAAIVGAVLLTLEKKPVIAGFFLALLTYKPQFGLAFPLVLLAERNWRALAAAAGFAALLQALSRLAFGASSFAAFFHYLPITENTILNYGTAGFEKMQSVFGLMRWTGFDERAAWIAHSFVALSAIAGVLYVWRRDVPYALKAAVLATSILIATPYLYMYDFPLLALPFAFLYRAGPLDAIEIGGAVVINLAMLVFLWVALPIGPVLATVTAGLLIRRVLRNLAVTNPHIALQRA